MRTGALPLKAASPFKGEVVTRSMADEKRPPLTISQYHPLMLNQFSRPFPVAAQGAAAQSDCATALAIW
jgi:hypothetical protein